MNMEKNTQEIFDRILIYGYNCAKKQSGRDISLK